MRVSATPKLGYDAWTASTAVHTTHGATTALNIMSKTPVIDTRYGWLWMPMPKQLAGRSVASAVLTGHAKGALAFQTLTFRSAAAQWEARTITHFNKPGTTGTGVAVNVAVTADGGEVTFDITPLVQAIADGRKNYGWRIETTATTLQKFSSFDSGDLAWSLDIEYDEDPEAPSALAPNGAVVGSAKPVVTFDFTEYGATSDDLASVRVEVDLTGDGTVDWDSGWRTAVVPALDLAAAGLTGTVSAGQSPKWRAYVKDTSGRASDPSDWATYTYRPLGVATFLTPASGSLYDPTTDVIVGWAGPQPAAYRLLVTDGDDRTSIRYSSGKTKTTDPSTIAAALPLKNDDGSRIFTDDHDYQIGVRIWDTYDRQTVAALDAQPAVRPYVDLWTTVHFDDDNALNRVTSFQAQQVDDTPWVQLVWTDVAAADFYVVSRDSVQIAKLDPADIISSASTYAWTDMGAAPAVQHSYSVRRLTTGVGRSKPRTDAITIDPEGVWLLRDNGNFVVLDGDGIDGLDILEKRLRFSLVNRAYDVDILSSYGGLAGPLALSTEDSEDQDLDDALAVLSGIKRHPTETVQFVAASISVPVRVSQLRWLPDPEYRGDMNRHRVLFNIEQVGDFDFKVH